MSAPTALAGRRQRDVPDSVAFLVPFVEAGVFSEAEVHLAAAVARLVADTPPDVLLAVAVAARGPRLGHICVVLDDVAATVLPERQAAVAAGSTGSTDEIEELPWPDSAAWAAALESWPAVVANPATAADLPLKPLVWDGTRLYLQRYWNYEGSVAESLVARASSAGGLFGNVDAAALEQVLDAHLGAPAADGEPNLQRSAAAVALRSPLSVIAGGPGTGKTTTVAKLLLAAADLAMSQGLPVPSVALAAPTGKAAARMTEAVTKALGDRDSPSGPATTIHRLLRAIPGVGFRANESEPIEADLVVVDETSMVDLSLMAHLLAAVRPGASLVLVGDPNQLASVEAGTVLGDIVAAATDPASPLAANLTVLTRVHRYEEASAIASLAEAIRQGDEEAAVTTLSPTITDPPVRGVGGDETETDTEGEMEWVGRVEPTDADSLGQITDELAGAGASLVTSARGGDAAAAVAAAASVKLLAATRRGELGLYSWTDRIEAAVAEAVEGDATTLRRGERWYVGKPVMVTANDPVVGVANGDVGVVVDDHGERMVALAEGDDMRMVLSARLGSTEPWWAMTVHKSQGSEFPDVVVSLPDHDSPILTRELLYTAVTRAKRSVTVVATEERIRQAVGRPVARASGLVGRLSGS